MWINLNQTEPNYLFTNWCRVDFLFIYIIRGSSIANIEPIGLVLEGANLLTNVQFNFELKIVNLFLLVALKS
jgi:hypothetical protein